MIDGFLHLRESHTGGSVVDIAIIVGEVECRDDGRLQVIVVRQGFLVLSPRFEERIWFKVRAPFRSSSYLPERHGQLYEGKKQQITVRTRCSAG